MVEGGSVFEHASKIRDRGHIPPAQVLIETAPVLKGGPHVRHQRNVPVPDVAVGGGRIRFVREPQVDGILKVGVGDRKERGLGGLRGSTRTGTVGGVEGETSRIRVTGLVGTVVSPRIQGEATGIGKTGIGQRIGIAGIERKARGIREPGLLGSGGRSGSVGSV